MAISLTPAHHKWRVRVFVATWLSYVGFYFCRQPWSKTKADIAAANAWDVKHDVRILGYIGLAYLIAYALGQFLASYMGPRLGPRRNVLLGMAVSVAVTLAMVVTPSWQLMAVLIAINGLAQATGWSGNVGTMASWFHRHERGKVMGFWSTNFTVGALLPGWVIGLVLHVATWPWAFYTGAAVLVAVWIEFYFQQRNQPEDVGLAPIADPVELDQPESGPATLSRDAWINIVLVGGFYFFDKFIRYGMWSWVPYFLKVSYGLSSGAAATYSTVFDLAGLPGVLVTGWLSDRYFGSKRGGISLIMMVGAVAATGLLIPVGSSSPGAFLALIAAIGFFLYGPDSLLTGAGAIDIGSRRLATRATAMISTIGSFGAVAQELAISMYYTPERGLGVVFAMLFGSAVLAAVFCAALVWRNRRGKGV